MTMTIDFESKDGRQNYLNEKLDNLLSGINASYGQDLLNELVTRLHRTLADFNEEVEGTASTDWSEYLMLAGRASRG